ncbi:MFS transporter [Streptomyces acidiscabies]|uniref:MFS transporter n=1 Tax=Streptomyces acidiscabies TaxID=42234 RepID=UPI0030CDE36D
MSPPRPKQRLGTTFWLLFCGESASAVGTAASVIALPLVAYQASGDVRQAGFTSTALSLGIVLARLPAGVLADRYERRLLLFVCNALGALVLGALALLQWADAGHPAVLLAAAFLLGAVGSTLAPAENVAVRAFVQPDLLPRALALLQSRAAFALIVGPLVGGVLLKVDAAWVFGADAGTYSVAACCSFLLPSGTGAGRDEQPAFRAVLEGLRFLWRSPFLRYGAINSTVLNLVFNGLLIVVIASSGDGGAGSMDVAVQTAALGAGALTGSLLAVPAARRLAAGRGVALATGVVAVALLGFATTRSTGLAALLLAVAAAAGPVITVIISSTQMRLTPPRLQGRVHSAGGFLAQAVAPLGPTLAGASAHAFGLAPTVTGVAVLVLLLAVAGWLTSGSRTVAADPADVPPMEARRG